MKQKNLFITLLMFVIISLPVNGQGREIISVETKNTNMVFSGKPGENITFLYWGAKIGDKT